MPDALTAAAIKAAPKALAYAPLGARPLAAAIISAVLPQLSCAPTAAPCPRSCWMAVVSPSAAARIRGVWPKLSRSSGSVAAPACGRDAPPPRAAGWVAALWGALPPVLPLETADAQKRGEGLLGRGR